METSKNTFGILTSAVLVEALVTYMNEFFVMEIFSWKLLLSVILGITVAVAYKIDLPSYFDMKSNVPYIGYIITGVLISRGSNYLFDLIKIIAQIQ